MPRNGRTQLAKIITPREYQIRAVEELREGDNRGIRRQLVMMPTGGGKSLVSCMVIESAIKHGSKCLFVAARRELVFQKSNHLKNFGIKHGVIMSGESSDRNSPVQVASLQTLHARSIRKQRQPLPAADVVIIDEAHGAVSETYLEFLDHYKDAAILGLSATPARGDGSGLGQAFDRIVVGATYEELRNLGFIVPLRVYAPYDKELLNALAHTAKGREFSDREAAGIVYRPRLVGRVVEHWKQICPERLTAVFCATIAHAQGLREEFSRAGVEADVIHSKMDRKDRKEVMRAFGEGEIRVLCNVDVLTEGVDIPPCSCAVLARPTRSLIRFRQAVGRILRPFPGKTDAIILDHAGAVYGLGFPDTDIDWPLEAEAGWREKNESKPTKPGEQPPPVPTICKKCGYAWVRESYAQPCPACGNSVSFWKKKTHTEDGYLTEINRDGPTLADSPESKRAYWDKAMAIAYHKGKSFWVARAIYKDHYKEEPPQDSKYLPKSKAKWNERIADAVPEFLDRKKGSKRGQSSKMLPFQDSQ